MDMFTDCWDQMMLDGLNDRPKKCEMCGKEFAAGPMSRFCWPCLRKRRAERAALARKEKNKEKK